MSAARRCAKKNVTLACSNATGDALREMGLNHADIAIVEVIPGRGYHRFQSNRFDQPLLLELLRTDVDVSDAIPGRKRGSSDPSVPIRKSPRLNADKMAPGGGPGAPPELGIGSDQVIDQPPSPLAASQRPYRTQLSRAKRTLHGTGPRTGMLYFLQIFTTYLQFLGEHYHAKGQDPVIFFDTGDKKPTKGWKAVP